MVRPFKNASRGCTHQLVAMDKFIKWIEAKPIAKFTSPETTIFFRDIIYRFGVPNFIIDNGTELAGNLSYNPMMTSTFASTRRLWHTQNPMGRSST